MDHSLIRSKALEGALSRCRAQDAQDCAQEVALRVIKGTTFVRPDGVEAYAYTAGKNAAIDLLRKARIPSVSLSNRRTAKKAKQMADPGPDHRLPLFEKLSRAMEELSEKEREVIVLTLRFEWNHEAVGSHLGMLPNTISQRFGRALKRLRDLCH